MSSRNIKGPEFRFVLHLYKGDILYDVLSKEHSLLKNASSFRLEQPQFRQEEKYYPHPLPLLKVYMFAINT